MFKGIKHNTVLYIIGGSFPKKKCLLSLMLKGNRQIKFIEFQDNDSKIMVLSIRHICSRYHKRLVINEAMEHGVLVITTNKFNAVLELINDYENGFIFEYF